MALLRKNSRTPSDPWLIAAEVAVSSVLQKSPKFATAGKGILAASGVLPFHSSELASALASLEMYDGNIKRANKLFETSLREPTDNSLAQAVWASNKTGLGQIHRRFFQIPNAQEAMTFNAANHGRWAEVLVHAEKWAEDESFSSRPRLIASSTASSLLGNPKQGEEIARAGLETNPGHPGLLNNIAFALIEEGKPAEALRAIEEINKKQMTPVDEICVLATSGMANFRLGNAEIGRRLYEAAIHTTEKRKQPALKTLATLYLARERVLQGDVEGFKQFRKAYDEAKKFNDQPRLLAIADRLSPQIRNAEKKLSAI
ncbi:MAG: hypothetical protein HZB20_03650 [Chloroflexi bacterium]|nr:hypothetical protein [Chloroflexota bacterium]